MTGWIGTRAVRGQAADRLRPHAGGHDDVLAGDVLAVGQAHAADTAVGHADLADRHPGPERATGRRHSPGKGRGQLARIDRVVVGNLEREAQRRRQRRLEPARLARAEPVHGEPERFPQRELAAERLRLVGVARGEERAAAKVAGIHPGGVAELLDELWIGVDGGEPEPHQRQLGRDRLGDRRQHARGDRGCAGAGHAGAFEHGDAQAALRGAPRDGEPDGAGAYNDDIG